MKRIMLLSLFMPLPLYAAGAAAPDAAVPADMMAAEVAHEQQVQAELDKLQKEREAAFLKQLEAEALIEEQRLQGSGSSTQPSSTAP